MVPFGSRHLAREKETDRAHVLFDGREQRCPQASVRTDRQSAVAADVDSDPIYLTQGEQALRRFHFAVRRSLDDGIRWAAERVVPSVGRTSLLVVE